MDSLPNSVCRASRGAPGPAWWSWYRHHLLPLVAVVFFVGVAAVFMGNPERSEWPVCFVRAALRMQAGQKIHVVENLACAYPPAMAMPAVPWGKPRAGGPLVALGAGIYHLPTPLLGSALLTLTVSLRKVFDHVPNHHLTGER